MNFAGVVRLTVLSECSCGDAMALTKSQSKAIMEEAQAILREFSDEPLPPTRELEDMTFEELSALLESRGVNIDWERLDADVRGAIGSDAVLIDRGVELDDAKIIDLEKRSMRAVVSTARSIANQTIGDMRQQAMLEADDRPDDEKYMVWVSVGNGCDSCADRHGTILAYDLWEGNAPRDGGTLCKGNCRCSLVPVGSPGKKNEGLRAGDDAG